MEKSLEQKIAELEAGLRYVIGNAQVSPSIAELVVRNVHAEVKALADINLKQLLEKAQAEAKEEEKDGDNTDV